MLQHLGAAARARHRQQQLGLVTRQPEFVDLALDTDEVTDRQLRQDSLRLLGQHPDGVEQRRIQRRVAEPDAIVLQTGGVQRRAQHAQRLGGTPGARRANQLDPGLQKLARLPALRPHPAVGVGEVAEAQGRLGVGVARRHQPRDRDRHVGS